MLSLDLSDTATLKILYSITFTHFRPSTIGTNGSVKSKFI